MTTEDPKFGSWPSLPNMSSPFSFLGPLASYNPRLPTSPLPAMPIEISPFNKRATVIRAP
jgi:hypothetical protein